MNPNCVLSHSDKVKQCAGNVLSVVAIGSSELLTISRGWMAFACNHLLKFFFSHISFVLNFVIFAAMLLYRISRCCRHIFVKLFHTIFHIFAIPCIALGFFAVFDSKMLQAHNHFYSLHSWMGLVTMGMFVLQVRYICIFFSFVISIFLCS